MRAGKRRLTAAECARRLGVHKSTVTRWIASGKLPAYRTAGGHHRVRPSDLEKLRR
jgi:excisionase family DNA binding protein